MAKLTWDDTGKRFFETGVSNGVLYPMNAGAHQTGVAWNGLVSGFDNSFASFILCFTAGKCGSRLAQFDIFETDISQV